MIVKFYNIVANYKILLAVLLILDAGLVFAVSGHLLQDLDYKLLPIKTITKEEIHLLNSNRAVINSLDSYQDIRLQPESSEAKSILDHFKKLRPNFLAEAIFVLPVKVGEEQAVFRDVKRFLQAVKTFGNIPYYSRQNGTWNPMFENIIIQESSVFTDGSEKIITEQMMRPFKTNTSVYRYYLAKNSFLYENFNSTPLYYKWMKAVDKEEMYTTLFVQAYPGYLFFYGLGGARAFDFFGLFGARLDVAFIGRIEAFFEWFHQGFVLGDAGQ